MAKFKSKPQKKNLDHISNALSTKRTSANKGSSSNSASSKENSSSDTETSEENQSAAPRLPNPGPARVQTTVKKSKKKIQGAATLKEIKRLQATTDLLIPKAPFLRIIRQIIFETTNDTTYRITEAAVEALRESAESVLVSIFEDSYLLALHAKRVTLFPRDMALLLRLRHDSSLTP